MGASKILSLQRWGFVHQPALCSTPTFCREVYFARMFDFYLFLSMNFAWMLGPWTPKKASFCRNLLLCHFPAFFSSVFKEQPILFVRKLAQWYVRPVFLQCWQKVKCSCPFFVCPRVELCWNARLTRTSGMALHFEILVVATLLLCNSTKAMGLKEH